MNDYAAEPPKITEADLGVVGSLANSLVQQAAVVEEIEENLKQAKARLRRLEEVDLPDALAAIGLSQVTTLDGKSVGIEEKLYASIPAASKPLAIQWLNKHGGEAFVQETLSVNFKSCPGVDVQEVVEHLAGIGVTGIKVEENVNTTSVKAFINENVKNGVDVPLKLFGAYFRRWAKVE